MKKARVDNLNFGDFYDCEVSNSLITKNLTVTGTVSTLFRRKIESVKDLVYDSVRDMYVLSTNEYFFQASPPTPQNLGGLVFVLDKPLYIPNNQGIVIYGVNIIYCTWSDGRAVFNGSGLSLMSLGLKTNVWTTTLGSTPRAGIKLFALAGVPGGNTTLNSQDSVFQGFTDLGLVDTFNIVVFNPSTWTLNSGGLTLLNLNGVFNATNNRILSNTGSFTLFTFTGTGTSLTEVKIIGCTMRCLDNQYLVNFQQTPSPQCVTSLNIMETSLVTGAKDISFWSPSSLYNQTTPSISAFGNKNASDSRVFAYHYSNTNVMTLNFSNPTTWRFFPTPTNLISETERTTFESPNGIMTLTSKESVEMSCRFQGSYLTSTASHEYAVSLAVMGTALACTFDTSTEIFTLTNHGFTTSTRVCLSGTLPTGLQSYDIWSVVNPTSNTFQISYTVLGGVIATTTNGTGLSVSTVTPTGFAPLQSFNNSKSSNVNVVAAVPLTTGGRVAFIIQDVDSTVTITQSRFSVFNTWI